MVVVSLTMNNVIFEAEQTKMKAKRYRLGRTTPQISMVQGRNVYECQFCNAFTVFSESPHIGVAMGKHWGPFTQCGILWRSQKKNVRKRKVEVADPNGRKQVHFFSEPGEPGEFCDISDDPEGTCNEIEEDGEDGEEFDDEEEKREEISDLGQEEEGEEQEEVGNIEDNCCTVETSSIPLKEWPEDQDSKIPEPPLNKKAKYYSKENFLRRPRATLRSDVKISRDMIDFQENLKKILLLPNMKPLSGRKTAKKSPYFDAGPFFQRRKHKELQNWKDMVLVNSFIKKHGLSDSSARDLVKLIHGLFESNGLKWAMHLSSTRLEQCCDKRMKECLPWKKLQYSLPSNVVGEELAKSLSPTTSSGADIMKRLAYELLMQENPELFVDGYREEYRQDSEGGPAVRTISYFPSSDKAHNINTAIQNECGEKHFALCLSLNTDETQSRAGKSSFNPVTLQVLNNIGDAQKLVCVLYIPTKLQQQDSELHKLLSEVRGVKTEQTRKDTIQMLKFKMQQDFINWIHLQMVPYQKNGAFFQIGYGENSKVVILHPFIVKRGVDGKERAANLGYYIKHPTYRCGICYDSTCFSCKRQDVGDFPIRDSRYVSDFRYLNEEVLLHKINLADIPNGFVKKLQTTMNSCGIYGYYNVNYDGFGATLEAKGVTTMHDMFNPDILHAVIKHLLESLVATIYQLITLFSYPFFGGTNELRRTVSGRLDDLLKSFPHVHSFDPVRAFKIDGISQYISVESQMTKNLHTSTAKILGNV